MPLQPLSRSSVVDSVYEALRDQILHGSFEAGDKLPTEARLTKQLQVSRSTVREALNRLASAGLVHIPHGGTKTVLDFREHAGLEVLPSLIADLKGQLDLDVVQSVVEMRAALAPDVARRAAQRRSDDQARDLFAAAEALAAVDQPAPRFEAVMTWWTALVIASGNLAYRLAYNSLRSTYTEGRTVMIDLMAEEMGAEALYADIATAVADGRGDRASQLTVALTELGTRPLLAAVEAARTFGGS